MNKRVYFIIAIVCFVVLMVWLVPSQKSIQAKVENNFIKNEVKKSGSLPQDAPLKFTESEIQKRIQESLIRRKLITLDENKLRKGILEKQMFHSSDADIVAKYNPISLSSEQKNDGRIFLSNDIYMLEGKNIGDTVKFNVPKYGLNREATITEIVVDPNDDIVSWSGYLEGGDTNSEVFHITQTVKDNFTIGTINSDGKTYALQIKNGYGWINNVENESATILASEHSVSEH